MDNISLLRELGLNEKVAKVYLAILELGSSTILPISQKSGVKRTSIYNFIEELITLGFVTKSVLRGRAHFQASPPQKIVDLQKSRLKHAEQALPELMGLFNALPSKPRVTYFEGKEQMKNIVKEELNCKREACYIWPGSETTEMVGGASFMNEIDRERIAKKIQIRSIRTHSPAENLYELSKNGPKFLREIRFGSDYHSAMGMGLYDTGKVSFFGSALEPFGLLIESVELFEMLSTLFGLYWEKALPANENQG